MPILVTGAAGFIGFHVTAHLLDRGEQVIGVDNLNEYYDVRLKRARLAMLERRRHFTFRLVDIADPAAMSALVERCAEIDGIVHLAAQAGVRHSLTHPYVYVEANVMGQLVVLEAARKLPRLKGIVYASSSSVYGANRKQPFSTADRVDHPVSLYAATKRAGELVTESYCRLYGLAATGLRFFTVYGPWGRPDMAYYLFTEAIFAGRPIELFNQGRMQRDFTYIDDVTGAVAAALDRAAATPAVHRLYNIGNGRPEAIGSLIQAIELATGRTAVRKLQPMQPGDIRSTFADITSAREELGYDPKTPISEGVPEFVAWYKNYHGLG
jgi:UDP-glucuronate 4-epimerase